MNEFSESVRTFQEIWTMYAMSSKHGQIIEKPGVLIAWAGVQWPIVNSIFLSHEVRDAADLKSRLDEIASFTASKSHFGMVVACDGWLSNVSDGMAAFTERGWIPIQQSYGMVAEDVRELERPVHLEYRRVREAATQQAAARINAASYQVPEEWGAEALICDALWDDAVFGFVGYSGKDAVTTATTYVRDKYLYVALVATLPEQRKHGFGTAATRHSIIEASKQSGLKRAVLHATPMARGIYESLGFRTVTTFTLFLPAALLSAHS